MAFTPVLEFISSLMSNGPLRLVLCDVGFLTSPAASWFKSKVPTPTILYFTALSIKYFLVWKSKLLMHLYPICSSIVSFTSNWFSSASQHRCVKRWGFHPGTSPADPGNKCTACLTFLAAFQLARPAQSRMTSCPFQLSDFLVFCAIRVVAFTFTRFVTNTIDFRSAWRPIRLWRHRFSTVSLCLAVWNF